MITESFHKHKDWDFRIRTVTNNGIWSNIFKDVKTDNFNSKTGVKRLYLRQKGYNFIEVNKLIEQTKTFIDNHESNLIQSLKQQLEKHNIKTISNN